MGVPERRPPDAERAEGPASGAEGPTSGAARALAFGPASRRDDGGPPQSLPRKLFPLRARPMPSGERRAPGEQRTRWERLLRLLSPPRKLKFTREGKYYLGITLGVGFAA